MSPVTPVTGAAPVGAAAEPSLSARPLRSSTQPTSGASSQASESAVPSGSRIIVRGAREHNLKGVDLDLPRDALIVFTGLSGSGKSSLAFDTLFKEGQRRFMESLSPYARQFLGQMEKPHVDHIEGLSPTISIDQKTINRNPRSTVGTITEVYDHLRLLFARLGTPHCPKCGREVASQTPEQITQNLYLEAFEGNPTPAADATPKRGIILAPIIQDRKGEYRKELDELLQEGWLRARIDGEIRDLREEIVLERYVRHTIEVVIDRVVFNQENRSRVTEAVEKALQKSNGVAAALIEEQYVRFATERACPTCNISIPEMEPRLFSFNSPHGACPTCEGLGATAAFVPELIVPEPSRSIADGAITCLTKEGRVPFSSIGPQELLDHVTRLGGSLQTPWQDLPEQARTLLMQGGSYSGITLLPSGEQGRRNFTFTGIIPALKTAWKYTKADFLEPFRSHALCPECHGTRLNPIATAVTFRGKKITEMSVWSVEKADAFFHSLELSPKETLIGKEIFKEIIARIHFLREVGLGYLSLERSAATLSGGEAQRIRLASQVGSGLQGVLYVLDEPSIGLHPRDNRQLLNTLVKLRDLGNTVLVVEHDKETMEAADFLVDVGPGAGREGGWVMAQGPTQEVMKGNSLSARYLKGLEEIPLPAKRRTGNGLQLTIRGARQNNLKGIDVSFPLGTFIAVTGVSGSGKSTLISDILQKALAMRLQRAEDPPGAHDGLEGVEHLDKVIEIDQAPIGRTPRSNPATYTKLFDDIRTLFAEMPDAKMRGYAKGRFSFNVVGGRCEACQGAGVKEIEMQFLANVEIPCEVCAGKRFNHETLAVKYRGKSINEVLELTITEAREFFAKQPRLRKILDTMVEVGLGYVSLGQPSTTLSGGEAQRVKLATELHRPATGRTLYILDEPTTGLHMADVRKLLLALQRLVDAGNTVLVIEHSLDVIKVADYLIDLGPEGGDGGGRLLACGTPEQVAQVKGSYTAQFLKEVLENHARADHGSGFVTASTVLPARPPARPRDLTVTGASKNNLKHVDVVIPKNKLTVVTGVSGSGKTSLAFDTLFAEGQRRYVESLSTYARRFLGRMDKAPVDTIDGIAPSISVDQKVAPRNPRSTVATATEINDYLRLLYARIGLPHCPTCGERLLGYSPETAARRLLELFNETRGELLAPLVEDTVEEDLSASGTQIPGNPSESTGVDGAANRGESGSIRKDKKKDDEAEGKLREVETSALLKAGFLRVRVDDVLVTLDAPSSPKKVVGHRIEGVLDRVIVRESELSRLVEGFENAFRQGDGIGQFRAEDGRRVGFSTVPGCLTCSFFLREELTPQMFSFNSHIGACARCTGLGVTETFAPHKLMSFPQQPFPTCLAPIAGKLMEKKGQKQGPVLDAMAQAEAFDLDRPWKSLAPPIQQLLLFGSGDKAYPVGSASKGTGAKGKKKTATLSLKWKGIIPLLEGWMEEFGGTKLLEELKPLMHEVPCPVCHGARLKKLPLGVKVAGLNISQLAQQTVTQSLQFFDQVQFSGGMAQIAEQILEEVVSRLGFLRDVGLEYLTLDRSSSTLSGGEAQRIRLASQLGSHLMGVLYVLDEPTIGLHPRDTDRLLSTLMGLRDRGNTVVVVEHDRDTMDKADYIVDMGPGAGLHGGRIVGRGTPAEIRQDPASITGAYLSGRRSVPVPLERRKPQPGVWVRGATANNLKNVDVHFPAGCLVCVTGVSGSGKSTLVMDVLAKALSLRFGTGTDLPGAHSKLEVLAPLQQVGIIDQSPLGRSPKSNPASYVGVFEAMRSLYASTNEAKARGYTKARFSFNLSGGRCEGCEGRGAIKVEMHFLSDVWVPCERCKGKRYNAETLNVTYRGKSIADVLSMEVSDALEFFKNHRKIHKMLKPLESVGLGYMQVGQPANTMSGGEAQRVKLAAALMERAKVGFYILDEPTTGLHFSDVEKLIQVLQHLVDRGNTVVVIEHNPDVMKVADYVIDMGPEGGARGGTLVVAGTPEQVVAHAGSHTGAFLRSVLEDSPRAGSPGAYSEQVAEETVAEEPDEAGETGEREVEED